MVTPKTAGWVLSMDQASNSAGVSLWYSDDLRAVTVLTSDKSTDSMARRLQSMVTQLGHFIDAHVPEPDLIRRVIFEGVQSRLVMITIGAFLTCPRIQARISPTKDFVQSSSWKSYAQKRGALGPHSEIKGVRALRDIGYDVDKHRIISDDIADSILIYLTWRDRK